MNLRRIAIVGGGIAGLTAAESLRMAGFDGELTMVGDEPHPAYSRPALSKALLRDRDDVTSHRLPPAVHGAVERLGERVTGIATDRHRLLLEAGEELSYDALVIATGCRAMRLGGANSGELTLRTVDDALALRDRIAGGPEVVVVGGGPLGMEIASACLAACCKVTLVSRGAPLRAQLGLHLSNLFTRAAIRQGLRIVINGAAGLSPDGQGGIVTLGDGATVAADLVVTAIGDVPNTEWLAGTPGFVGRGALAVDSRGRFRPGVVAAGDVAMVPTPSGPRRLPLWNSAIEQARVAAAALVLGDTAPELDHRPYFWTEQFGLSLKAVGHLPFHGAPAPLDGEPGGDSALLRWDAPAIAAVNYRISIPRLRRLCDARTQPRQPAQAAR